MNYSQQEIEKRKKAFSENSNKISYRIKKYFAYVSAIIGIVFIFMLVIGVSQVIRGIINHTPKIQEMDLLAKGNASVIYDIAGKKIQKLDETDINSEYIAIKDIPKPVQQAFIAIEDKYFYEHHGVDMSEIMLAVSSEFMGSAGKGQEEKTSTITVQLVENQILDAEKKNSFMERVSEKITKQLLAVSLEDSMSKQQILEYYLNTINLGEGVIGVQAAAQRYFDKDIMDVTKSEAAVLAAIVIEPQRYEPVENQENNTEKRKEVLKCMLDEHYITEDEYEDALGDNVYFRIKNVANTKINTENKLDSYYADAVVEQVILDMKEKLGYTQTQAYNALYRGGLKIYSCQDSSIQKICNDVINNDRYYPITTKSYLTYSLIVEKDGVRTEYSEIDVKNYTSSTRNKSISLFFSNSNEADEYVKDFKEHTLKSGSTVVSENIQLVKQPQASFVLMEQSTGRVKAIVGGRGQRLANRALNRATEDTRQPGSVFGVLSSYLPALDTAGMTLGTRQGEEGNIMTTLRTAITNSVNISAINALKEVSERTGYDYLKKLGFSTIVEQRKNEDGEVDSDIQLQMAIGELAEGVTNLELTAAYATIANQGIYQRPRFYTKVIDEEGNVLLENDTDSTRVMKESTAWLLTDAMEDVVTKGTATKVKFDDSGMALAGKTGTTKDYTDFWFEGYSPYYTAGIWTGEDEGSSLGESDYHLSIWKEIMTRVHQKKGLTKGRFKMPDGMISVKICTECGKKAVDEICDNVQGKSYVRMEYYSIGTQPMENCDCHMCYSICKASEKMSGENCPKSDVYTKVFKINASDAQTTSNADLTDSFPKEICDIHNE